MSLLGLLGRGFGAAGVTPPPPLVDPLLLQVADAVTYEINLERYKSGDLSSKDMQFYQQQLSTQKLNEVSALINYKLALLDIKIRSLWDFGKNVSIVEKI